MPTSQLPILKFKDYLFVTKPIIRATKPIIRATKQIISVNAFSGVCLTPENAIKLRNME